MPILAWEKRIWVQVAGLPCREYLPRKVAFIISYCGRICFPLCKSGKKSRELEALEIQPL